MTKLLLVVAAALINKNNQVLIAQRPKGKSLADLWEFPGGKIENGERPEEALIRELKEELGIEVNEKDLIPLTFVSFCYQDFHLLMPLWAIREWKGAFHPYEHQALCWVSKDELGNFNMPPADIPLKEFLYNYLWHGHD
jgi:8-oxo-dGTP diphosphatase